MTDIEITSKPEPVKVMVPRFECAFCGSGFRRSKKKLVADHMKICWSEKAKRTCRTCVHFDRSAIWGGEDVCDLGQDVPENAPVVNCPLWRDRDEEEDKPFVDAWDHGLRELGGDAR